MGIKERQNNLVAEFAKLSNWENRYKKIISKAKALPDLPEKLKTAESKVQGCQSQVWFHASLSAEGKIQLQADSDALLVKGLVAVLLEVYNDSTPAEIISSSADFLKDLGFDKNLSPSRTNGLYSMLKQIHHFAIAYQALLNSQKK